MNKTEFEPKVSIIVPVRNGESTIEALLQSLLKMDYERNKIEVVVVDGNSIDKTKEIVAKYPVKLVTEERNGLNAARNTGIVKSTGEIIAFTDSDCIIPADWIKKIVENFMDPQVGCVGGNVKGYDYKSLLSHYADNSIMPVLRLFKKRQTLDRVKLFENYPAGCNMALSRKTIEEVGYFDEKIRLGFDEDELVERICKAGFKMVMDPNVIVWHQHRSTLKGLLKQTFRYGGGLGLILKKKKAKTTISKWALFNLLAFIVWVSLVGAFTFSTLTTSLDNTYVLLGITLGPFLALMVFYTYRALQNKRYEGIILYPFIDFLRVLAFWAGEIYELLKL